MKRPAIAIAIASGQGAIGETVRSTLSALGQDFVIVAEVVDGIGLLDAIKKHIPSLVMLDFELPNLNGLEILTHLNAIKSIPQTKVIILSSHYNASFLRQLKLVGASGFLSRSFSEKDFSEAFHGVFADAEDTAGVLELDEPKQLPNSGELTALSSRKISLTDREIEIVELLCQGCRHKEIARALNITIWTVRYHMKSLYKKTRQQNSTALVKYAVESGIICFESGSSLGLL